MASEDSDQILSGFSMIHGFSDFRDLDQPFGGQMPAFMADFDAPRELLEILALGCAQRIRSEKRNDHPKEVMPSTHDVAMQMLLVIVVPPIDADSADTKESLHLVQRVNAFGALNHHKAVGHLISGFVASPTCSVWLPNKPN